MKRFSCHNHTEMSNIRIIDSTNKLEDLVKRGIEIGLAGLAITDHETIANSVRICQIQEKYPDFKIAIGNEIYLTDTRDKSQQYYHFILIAKDKEGHRQLRELSSVAWLNSYYDRGIERVPTLKKELEEVVRANPGHLIATTACIGGEASTNILRLLEARRLGSKANEIEAYNNIINFFEFCISLFGEDFYIEIAPGASKEQVAANQMLCTIANQYNLKVVIGDDAHYLKREDRYVHKAYLNSSNGEREVDAFYQYAFLHNDNDCIVDLTPSFGDQTQDLYKMFCEASMEMYDKIEIYDIRHAQTIPSVEVKDYPILKVGVPNKNNIVMSYETLSKMFESEDKYDRYWVNQCVDKLNELNKLNDTYLSELEHEAETKKVITV